MNFSWDDDRRIHPKWPERSGQRPTIVIPSTQKNKRAQEIPMLPGLVAELAAVPEDQRRGWVVNPLPMETSIDSDRHFRPAPEDLAAWAGRFSNVAIARACGVTETAVRKWLAGNRSSSNAPARKISVIPDAVIATARDRVANDKNAIQGRDDGALADHQRLTKERVSRVIGLIGVRAGIVVQQADDSTGRRIKFATAHDLRRGCAQRLINAGVSAETLKVVMRHRDFKTTERFYGAIRSAQSAAAEIAAQLDPGCRKDEFVGGLVGGPATPPRLTEEEIAKLKSLLNSL